ncbi:MAG: AmmeMemoRadiSam system protein B, partial [Mesorhizobium sp.]
YKRIVILSPDHFHKTHKLYATTARGFDTVLGPVKADTDAVRVLEKNSDMVEESCLFDKEHGVRAMLPFLHHYFPEAKIVPVAMSVKARRRDWDRLAEALKTIVDNPTRPKDKIYYLAGDVNFGRAMKKILVRDGVADRIVDSILSLTNSRPLIVNLEGVILPNVPEAIDDMTLAMPEGLAV